MSGPQADNLKVNVPYDDLRQWMAESDKLGELKRANGYNWQEQIGMAAELLQHRDDAPVALFDEIPGAPKGHRVLTNFFGKTRQNMTLGFPPHLNKVELSEAFLKHFQTIIKKPMLRPSGDQRSSETSLFSKRVSAHASPPSPRTAYRFQRPERFERNAIVRPSGDHAGF